MQKLGIALALAAFLITPAHAQDKKAKPPQNVIVAKAHTEDFVDRVEALGTLRANETVNLTANVTEVVTAVTFEDGARVSKGDVLVEMRGGQEKAQLAEEQATVSEAKKQVDRTTTLVATGAAAQTQLDEQKRNLQTANARLDAIRATLGDRIITAPFDGVLGMRNISVGALIQPGTMITTLDDDSVMKLDFTVPSIFLSAIKIGLPITATSPSFPDKKFKGTIASVGSQIDPETRSIPVRALINNDERALKPGLLMSVDILKNPRKAIVIPEEAIVPEARKSFVFVTDEKTAKKVEVKTGARQPGKVEILEGLEGDELVITHGTMTVTDGGAVNITARDDSGKKISEMLQAGEKKEDGKDKKDKE